MAWFHVDDDAADHPKIVAAGNAAVGAWCRMGAWAAKHLTEGFIPREMARRYATTAQLKSLLECRLVEVCDGGYELHDYLDANPSHTQIIARRAADAERQRRLRQRRNTAPTDPDNDPMSRRDSRHVSSRPAPAPAPGIASSAAATVVPAALNAAAAAAVEIFITHRLDVEGRNVKSSTRYAAKIRRDEVAAHADELAAARADADPVDVAAAVFSMTKGDAIRASIHAQKRTRNEIES